MHSCINIEKFPKSDQILNFSIYEGLLGWPENFSPLLFINHQHFKDDLLLKQNICPKIVGNSICRTNVIFEYHGCAIMSCYSNSKNHLA